MSLSQVINSVLLPVKLVVPQPVIKKIPGLTTNEDIRFEKVLSFMQGKALDIGCGANRLIKRYVAMGNEGIGVDVFDWGGQDLVVEDTANLPFEDGQFDVVTFVACLNHIPNRAQVLVEAARVLKPGGRIVFTYLSPFVSLVWHKFAFWDDDQHERGMIEGEVYGFNDEEIDALVRGANLRVAHKESFSLGLNKLVVLTK